MFKLFSCVAGLHIHEEALLVKLSITCKISQLHSKGASKHGQGKKKSFTTKLCTYRASKCIGNNQRRWSKIVSSR